MIQITTCCNNVGCYLRLPIFQFMDFGPVGNYNFARFFPYRYRLYTFYYLSSVPVFDFFWLFGHRIFRLVPRTTDSRVAFFQGGGLTQKKELSSQETPRATKNTPNAAISPNTCFVPFFQGNSYRVVSDTAMPQHDHAARGGRKC